ncbi:hypothetical protein AB0L56_19290 [Streptomyces sp. NPDC052079]|uniref:hypothetical protein n=1 Tax=Streptomyces sp. NPDC052079 TaxID=3155526 RepID=UPI00343444A8
MAERLDGVGGRTALARPGSQGDIVLTGPRVAGAPFSVRIGRLGLRMVEEAAEGLRLAV